jgi:hypothetical protein
VKIAKPAFERHQIFRSSNSNHFMSQVLTFHPGALEAPVELVCALCMAVGLWIGDGGN